jgi:outer membrane receptor for ferrienterochelin and colicins
VHRRSAALPLGVALLAATSGVARADSPVALGEIEDVEALSLGDLLEQPVTAASRYSQKPADSPTLVSTIDRETIERFGYRTLRDALQGMRGVYTSNDRNYSYIGTRGFSIPGDYNTRIGLTIDNHRINDPTYGQAAPGAELGLPMIAIERVEMIRGGSWSVYGDNALLGAIQIVTATGATRPGLHVTSTTRANLETFEDPANRSTIAPRGDDISASYGVVEDGIDVFVAGNYSFDPGLSAIYIPELAVDDEPCVNQRMATVRCDGIVRGGDAEEVAGFYASAHTNNLTLHALSSRRRKRAPTAAFGTTIGESVQTFDDRLLADLEYARTSERADIVARIAADYYGYRGDYPYLAAADRYLNIDEGSARWWTGEMRGRYKFPRIGRYLTDVELAAGAEASTVSTMQRNRSMTSAGVETLLDRTDPQRKAALFAHASGRALDHLLGFAAVRADYQPDSFDLSVNPQGGLVLDGGELGRIRASMARGFRAPNAYEQFYGGTMGVRVSENLQPEHSETLELSLEHYLGEHVRLLVVGFRQDVTGLLTLTTADDDGIAVFDNQGGVRSYGVESEIEGRWDRVRLHATYSRYRARTTEGERPPNSPASLASLTLAAPIVNGRAEVGVESYFVGARTAFNGNPVAPLFTTSVVMTIHDVLTSLDLTLGVTNLFDERGGDPSSEEHRESLIPHDPRTVWLRLSLALER